MKLRFKKDLLDKKNKDFQPEAAEVIKNAGDSPVEITAVKVEGTDLFFNISDFEVIEEAPKK